MIKAFSTYNLYLKLVLLGLLSFSLLLVSDSVLAQETTQKTESVADLKYPIEDLGGCADFNSCNTYCSDPVNYNSCTEYAKQNGFYESDKVQAATDTLWQDAQQDLGCNSKESCLEFCSQEANFDKCNTFAEDQDIIGGYVKEPDQPEFIEKAKEVLGCDSANSCMTFCGDPANTQKCQQFANQVGLRGGEVREGPGGCSSEATCKSFCSDPNNFNACRVYAPPNAQFKGPGGCSNPDSCRTHCEQNPDSCRSYAPGSNGKYVPVVCPEGQYFGPGGACTPNDKTQEATSCAQSGKYWSGNGCQDQAPPGIDAKVGNAFFQPRPDMGNCKTPGECYDYCKENPSKCGGFNTNTIRPPDTYVPTLYYTPGTVVKHEPVKEMGNCQTPGECYDYCKENPGKCQGFSTSAPRPLDNFVPGTYYTPPANYVYTTPSSTSFYVTPIYYTPAQGSSYTTPSYFTPGSYYTPNYYTPPQGSNYTTPTYYTPGSQYYTPSGSYPTPNYVTPTYYTPPSGSTYTTPNYNTPAPYNTPSYYTPPAGSTYTSPVYNTPASYNTPSYYTPSSTNYPSPSSGTPYNYPTPSSSGTSYSYPTPSTGYTTPNVPNYPTPSSYTTPSSSYSYPTPSYNTPNYETPPSYNTPSYNTPSYETPPPYSTPVQGASTKLNFFESLWYYIIGQ